MNSFSIPLLDALFQLCVYFMFYFRITQWMLHQDRLVASTRPRSVVNSDNLLHSE